MAGGRNPSIRVEKCSNNLLSVEDCQAWRHEASVRGHDVGESEGAGGTGGYEIPAVGQACAPFEDDLISGSGCDDSE